MNDSQLMRGVLEQCVLAEISRGETYGYEILTRLSEKGFDELVEGTLYPVLTRLHKKGWIACRAVKSPFGPVRKLYTITDEGLQELEEFREIYRSFSDRAEKILFGEGGA